ncbi:MAG: FRG domain-containing protein [Planctomycetes bacterium]|nr:FRG domain-containing protein [Planctomycetota bacterium]
MQPNVVGVVQCESWDDFIKRVRTTSYVGDRVFRGQRRIVDWRLESQWERWLRRLIAGDPDGNVVERFSTPQAYGQIRDGYLERFKSLMRGVSTARIRPDDPDREWWALGRHHGLITPLLDWTRSPYIAAYFAFVDYTEARHPGFREGKYYGGVGPASKDLDTEPLAVWELHIDDALPKAGEFEIFSSRGESAYRELAQQGCFTWLTHDRFIDLESYCKSRGLARLLGRYEIPGTEFLKALWDLHLMNINEATLFPDGDGAARQANWGSNLSALAGIGPQG